MKYFYLIFLSFLTSFFAIRVNAEDSWKAINSPANEFVFSLFVSNNIILAGTGGETLWSSNQGEKWNSSECVNGYAHSEFDYAEDSKGRIYAGAASGVFMSSDNGKTWYMIKDDRMVSQVELDELDNIYSTAQTQDNFFKLYFSSNGGQSWNNITPKNKNIDLLSLKVVNSKLAILSIGNEILYSTDKGVTWEEGAEIDQFLNINSIVSTKVGFLANSSHNNVNKGIYESTDGMKWHSVNTNPAFINTRWLKYNNYNYEIYGFDIQNGILKSTDNGTNWINYNEGIPAGVTIYDIAFSKDGYIYAAASNQKIYQRATSINAVPEDLNNPISDISIYPNPASGNFFINSKADGLIINKVELYDVEGRILTNFKYSFLNDYTLEACVEGIRTGFYFLNLSTIDKTFTKTIFIFNN